MIKKHSIACSQCRQVSELFLTSDPPVIVFSCPVCNAPLLSYGSHLILLNDEDVEGLRNGDGVAVIQKILHSLETDSGKEPPPDSSTPSRNADIFPIPRALPQPPHPVTDDDIIDLHLLLSSCADVQEFINRL